MISDDELDAPIYAGGDSSDDEQRPTRGDIRPSSFRPKEPKTTGGQARLGKTVSSRHTLYTRWLDLLS
jgi:SWI/SNF-related matrix-associated actin-dependent regulator 1 of chromatin subfamily A